MFKVNNNFEHISHLGVSIVNFEQVNAGWVGTCFSQSAINSINPFHGTSQGLWIKGSPLEYLVTGSSLFLKKISQNDHSLLFVVPGCTTRCSWFYHSLSLAVPLVVILCHFLPSLVTFCTTCCHSFSVDAWLVCFFINVLFSPFYSKPLFCSLQLSRCLTILIRNILFKSPAKKYIVLFYFTKNTKYKKLLEIRTTTELFSKHFQRGITLKRTSLTARLYGCSVINAVTTSVLKGILMEILNLCTTYLQDIEINILLYYLSYQLF